MILLGSHFKKIGVSDEAEDIEGILKVGTKSEGVVSSWYFSGILTLVFNTSIIINKLCTVLLQYIISCTKFQLQNVTTTFVQHSNCS